MIISKILQNGHWIVFFIRHGPNCYCYNFMFLKSAGPILLKFHSSQVFCVCKRWMTFTRHGVIYLHLSARITDEECERKKATYEMSICWTSNLDILNHPGFIPVCKGRKKQLWFVCQIRGNGNPWIPSQAQKKRAIKSCVYGQIAPYRTVQICVPCAPVYDCDWFPTRRRTNSHLDLLH